MHFFIFDEDDDFKSSYRNSFKSSDETHWNIDEINVWNQG